MRKIYLAIVMALSACLASAVNSPALERVGSVPRAANPEKGIMYKPSSEPSYDVQAIQNLVDKTGRKQVASLSRTEASEPFNFTDYYLWTFLDPEVNYFDDNGQQLSSIPYIFSSTETIMREVGDSIEVNWYYYTSVPFMYRFYITQNEDGNYVIKLGQEVADGPIKFYDPADGKEKYCNMLLAGGFIEEDPNNPEASGRLVIKESGEVQFYLTDDPNILTTNAYSLFVLLQDIEHPNEQKKFFNELLINQLCKPNATLAYQFLTYNNNYEPVVEDINSRVYYSFEESSYAPYPEDPEAVYDSYFVSNVTPYVMGLGVRIANLDVGEEYSPTGFLWMADNQPAFPPQATENGGTTGKLYMNSVYVKNDRFNFYDREERFQDTTSSPYPCVTFKEGTYTDINGKEYVAFTFPNSVPDCNEEISYWGLTSKITPFADGFYTPAALVFDFVGDLFTGEPDTNGIQDVIQDAFEGTAEYYDLQGIKVANPAPGKIYIVKEGSKVSKRIF